MIHAVGNIFITILLLLSLGNQAKASCDCAVLAKKCQTKNASKILNSKTLKHCTKKDFASCGMEPQLDIQLNLSQKWERKPKTLKYQFISALAYILSPQEDHQNTQKVEDFRKTLITHKDKIKKLYGNGISNSDYDKLSLAALGILGAESTFYKSPRYKVKKNTSEATRAIVKCAQRGACLFPFAALAGCYLDKKKGDDLGPHLFLCMIKKSKLTEGISSGPTQIKKVPKRAAEKFKITARSLFENPEHAAIATMAFLIELKAYAFRLKRKYPKSLKSLNKNNYVDYLVYLYQGKGRRVVRGEVPSVQKNNYLSRFHDALSIVQVKRYNCIDQSHTDNASLISR